MIGVVFRCDQLRISKVECVQPQKKHKKQHFQH